jgi:hypothetical protein
VKWKVLFEEQEKVKLCYLGFKFLNVSDSSEIMAWTPAAYLILKLFMLLVIINCVNGAPVTDGKEFSERTYKDFGYGDGTRRTFFFMLKMVLGVFGKH